MQTQQFANGQSTNSSSTTAHAANDRRAHDARAELERLMAELHKLVSLEASSGRTAVEGALPTAAKLQVATANVDACNPTRRAGIAAELVVLADRRIRPMRDGIERALGYTAETTMRRLSELS